MMAARTAAMGVRTVPSLAAHDAATGLDNDFRADVGTHDLKVHAV